MNFIAMLMLAADLNGQPLPDVVLLDFTAGYCQPCQQMVPVLQRMEQDNFPVRRIDITENPDTSRQYKVDRIPTLILLVEGREAKRFVGLTGESELRQAMNEAAKKLDMTRRANGGPAASPDTPDELAAAFEETPAAASASTNTDGNQPRPGLRGLFDRVKNGFTASETAGRDLLEHPDFRAQSPDEFSDPSFNQPLAMPSCVRVRLIDGKTFDSGTGTIVHSTAGQSTIVTCAHVFKEVSDNAQVVVDVFKDGGVLKYPARVIGGDHNSDVAFITIQNTAPLPTSPLADRLMLKADEAVFSIGCNNGDQPTRMDMNVIAVNRYQGPENIVCTLDPVQGRSGGGLFNKAGQLVGVCSGAFRKTKEGLYTGISPVRSLAEQLKLTHILGESAPVFRTAQATAPESAPKDASPFDDEDLFDELFEESASPFDESLSLGSAAPAFGKAADQPALPDPFAADGSTGIMTAQGGGNELPSEITVIIDSKDPSKGKRVIVIPKPSPWLLELLTGEPAAASNIVTTPRSSELSTTASRQTTTKAPVVKANFQKNTVSGWPTSARQ